MSKRVEQKRMKPYSQWQYVSNDGTSVGSSADYPDFLPQWLHNNVANGFGRIVRVRMVEEPEPKVKKARSKR